MGQPRRTLTVPDVVALIVGVVVGAGIFRTPSLVARHSEGEAAALLLWALGGAISLVGALCYAELASTYPSAGGDYHYLTRSFGRSVGFLFAWSRLTVIQTGSLAMQAFLVGDYASAIAPVGRFSASFYAALSVVALTALNVAGLRQGKRAQAILSTCIVGGLVLLLVLALPAVRAGGAAPASAPAPVGGPAGLALIFVLLTYGGWNEAAYLSAELRDGPRAIRRALVGGLLLITALYLAANWVLMRALGHAGVAASEAVFAELAQRTLGGAGAGLVSLLVVVAALGTMNATLITGARTGYAVGCDFERLGFLGQWQQRADAPRAALVAQGGAALVLVALGTLTRSGFAAMVEYTAPVFWFFFLLVGVAVLVLRRREPDVPRAFRVPLYPLTPLVFCAVSFYMLVSSVAYTGIGALVGIAVLLAGVPLLLVTRPRVSAAPARGER